MTTYASAPGTRLGGRYRLEDRIAAGSGWDAWKAIDETLARAVTVFTLASGFPRVGDVVTAARAASRLTDPRLAQVFDVEEGRENAYIVMEWAAGETLGDLIMQGRLEPFRAARMIAEAAGALASAHAAGVAHMCLSPGSVRWSPTGEVKVVGLGIDAALAGICSDDPVVRDTQGLGKLLYAALTAHWPGSEFPSLPPAPVAGGEPCSPRQVVAGIPLALSDLTCRAMQLQGGESDEPLTTPGELSRALRATLPPVPLPAAAAPPAWRDQASRTPDTGWIHGGQGPAESGWPRGGALAATDSEGEYDEPASPASPARRRAGRPGRVRDRRLAAPGLPSRYTKGILVAAGVLALAAIEAKYAIDGNANTDWTSQWYASPEFGQLKAGSGLMIDMGRPVRFASVTVTFNSEPGADVQLLVGNSADRSKQNLETMKRVAVANNPTGTVTFHVTSQVTGRFLVIWFTRLPPQPGTSGMYEAQIFNVSVRGTPAGG